MHLSAICYIEDAIKGIRAAMDYNETEYEIINLGNNRTVALSEVIKGLEHVLGIKAEISYFPNEPGDIPRTWADIEKARSLIRYRPVSSFSSGLESFAKWIK